MLGKNIQGSEFCLGLEVTLPYRRLKICLFFPSSCFLLCMKDDSIEGIYDTLKHCALISKSAGGIGVAVSCIRATGSYIAGVCLPWAAHANSCGPPRDAQDGN